MKKALYISLMLFAFNLYAQTQIKLTNTNHLDFLYEDITIAEKQLGIVHIYSNYPDYEWAGDDDEGTACVDDAARAAVFYLKYGKVNNDEESIRKAKNLLEFVIYMQSENGYLYNFIWQDGSINRTHQNSINEANWWTWRGLWSLMEGYEYYKDIDSAYANFILEAAGKTVETVKKNIPAAYNTQTIGNFTRPSWLPSGTAADQASVLLIALTKYYNITKDDVVLAYCKKLGDGIMLMQEGSQGSYPYGAFLSWENTWHGWGNSQSYSLLNLFETVLDSSYLKSALKEVNYFYNYILGKNYLSEFAIGKIGNMIFSTGEDKYPQIAYTIRPMVYASLKAYEITNDTAYALKAAKLASWFYGKNAAGAIMYNRQNGICFDGMNGSAEINKNSGAESTIEALLSLQGVESNVYAAREFNKLISVNSDNKQSPESFMLSNNYPNPFNPVTSIDYSIMKSSQVSIIVYNVLGEKVKILVNDYHNSGSYTVSWDGKDEKGLASSSGIYFYQMISGDYSVVKKMILLK